MTKLKYVGIGIFVASIGALVFSFFPLLLVWVDAVVYVSKEGAANIANNLHWVAFESTLTVRASLLACFGLYAWWLGYVQERYFKMNANYELERERQKTHANDFAFIFAENDMINAYCAFTFVVYLGISALVLIMTMLASFS